jgi:phenol hydroxylase P4 protein
MSVHAITADYHGENRDAQDNFHGSILIYVGWDHHLLFCASKAFPVPATMSFSDLIEQIMSEAFSQHPEFSKINWDTATWLVDNNPLVPVMDKTLKEQGISHKSMIRFATPELKGYASAGV